MGLYNKIRSILEPNDPEAQKKKQIHDSIVARSESRISSKSNKPKPKPADNVCEIFIIYVSTVLIHACRI